MKKRRILTAVLAVALAAGLWKVPASAVYQVNWDPQPADWAKEQMEDLADAGILAQGTYNPTAVMTRGRFCYFMVHLVQRVGRRDLLRQVKPMPADYFDDVASETGYGGRYNVYTAASYGLTEGALVDGRRLADCDSDLTREQGAKMMCALMDALEDFTGMDAGGGSGPVVFADADSISPWARESVDRASSLGILKGDEAGRFNPQGVLTFQEACVMLDRAFRQAEEAGVKWDADHGIRSFVSQLEEDADRSLEDAATRMYWLENGRTSSVLQIKSTDDGGSEIRVEDFDAKGNSIGVKEIPVELAYCAAFYEGEDACYLAFGQNNMEEDDGKEVYRIVKYDRDWNRLGAASVTAGESYTTQPYRSTSHTALAEQDGMLVLHTARLRYQSADGLRHQSNITIKVRTSDMRVLSVSPRFPGNHVSHSFAQYVAFDGDEPVYADHGDAYPRGFALNLDTTTGNGREMNFFPFSGETGDNNTNAYPGGFGIGADHYLFAGSSFPQDGNDKRTYCNVFLAVVPKEGFPNGKADIQWLTGYPRDGQEYVSAVQMVQLNNNTFVVMWQSIRQDPRTGMGAPGEFRYAVFDGTGKQVGETRTMENFLMPLGDATVRGDRILWVRPEMGAYDVFMNSRSRYLKVYELQVELNRESGAALRPVETATPSETPGPGEGSRPSGGQEPPEPAEEGPATTVLPADGVTDRYCMNWGKGKWMELEMVDGDTIRLSGRMPELPGYYNSVVLQAYREQAETPLVLGEEFSIEVTIDVERFLEAYEASSSKIFYVTAMVCQNHEPGEADLAGMSFDSSICLVPNGSGGCTLRVIER